MKRQIFTLSLLAWACCSYGQSSLRELIRGNNGISRFDVRLPGDKQVSFSPSSANTLFGLDALSDLRLHRQETDKLGYIHYRYGQTYKGIPVENAMYIVHTQKGRLAGMSGSIVVDFEGMSDLPSRATIAPQKAVSLALQLVPAKQYAWQDAALTKALKQQKGAAASFLPAATLVWFGNGAALAPREMKLAYKVDVYALKPLSRADYFFDATTGEYLGKNDKIYYTDATGTAATAYSGSQTIHSDLYNGSYRLRDLTKGNGVHTLHGESGSKGSDYTSTSPNWTLTSTSQAALDAHYGVSQTYAYYKTNFNRNSYDGNGTTLTSYVNVPNTTDNAYWDGVAMYFGKRSTGAPGGVTGIDVTGHELTHGVTQASSNLTYSREPGAMNESMSDIFGKAVQFWSKPSDIDWRLSNDMNWFIRNMANPNAYSQPDTYKGTYWATSSSDNYGVHTNSGVGNFMFYLLVTGGSGTNDLGNSYTVNGIGLTDAAAILYRSNTLYLVASSQYADWRTACISAATDLFGSGSAQVSEVQNAWYAVGIGAAAGGGTGCATPGSLTAGSITNTSAVLSWSAAVGANSYTLQWKPSSASTWTTVTGLTSTSYSLTGLAAGTSYQFAVAAVCASATSAYSSPYAFTTNTGTVAYCASSGGSNYEFINKVVLGSISNTSGNNGGYANFTNLTTGLTAGSSYTATLTPGFTGSSYNEAWTLWIDYNGDGDFADSGEKVGTKSGKSTVSISFTVPATAKNGNTRIRIQMKYSSASSNSCLSYSYGEVEDYTAVIAGGSGLSADRSTLIAALSVSNSILVAPNPVVQASATVSYGLAKGGAAAIKVVDMAGRTAQVYSLGSQQAGMHTLQLPVAGKLNSGSYFLILEQNGAVISRTKMVVQ